MPRTVALGGVLFALAISPVFAAAAPAPAPAPAPPPSEAAAPPYEDELLRLAEILGAEHYLSQLCSSGADDTLWRDQMQQLLDTGPSDETGRARMVDRFNHGYDSYRSVYLSCTPAATEASQRYLAEGAKIAEDITARYGR